MHFDDEEPWVQHKDSDHSGCCGVECDVALSVVVLCVCLVLSVSGVECVSGWVLRCFSVLVLSALVCLVLVLNVVCV